MFFIIALVMTSRLILVYLFYNLFKLCKPHRFVLKQNDLAVVWMGGSVRGAICFGLINGVTSTHKDLMKAVILGMVVFTTVVVGIIMP
mmetsp:Transcript_14566/g.2387  ORF Transcript_14566/g.2387 Transcript_14566/m.2387 type:complete len:88 (+) Transcript_14566:325-588(+)